MTSDLVTDGLMMAIGGGDRRANCCFTLIKAQYASDDLQRVISAHGIECSISRRGDVWDNAAMESFSSSLKVERTDRRVYRTRDDARAGVFDYMERFSSLDYLSPMEFEKGAEQT